MTPIKLIKDCDSLKILENLLFREKKFSPNKFLIPIAYRLGYINEALQFGQYLESKNDEAGFRKFNNWINKDRWQFEKMRIVELINNKSYDLGINLPLERSRIKSFFSFKRKSVKLKDCYDLYGLEFFFEEDDFFSTNLIELIETLKNEYFLKEIKTLMLEVKFLPCLILRLVKNGFEFQIKMTSKYYDYSNLAFNYFNYKRYNIDNLMLSEEQLIKRILIFSQFEKIFKGKSHLNNILFQEMKLGEYTHETLSINNNIKAKYLKNLAFTKKMARACMT